MSTTFKELLAAIAQITIGCDGLAASATVGRSSAVVDNSTNLYQDALVSGVVQTAAGTPGGSKAVYIYAYADVDGTPHYTDGASGSAGGFTRTDPPNLRLIDVVNVPAGATNYYFGPFSVANAFGGTLPNKWGLAVFNDTGLALGGTATQDTVNVFNYRGVQTQGV